ncbi:hypothetical protein [Reyranella aquatilis]|jgi:hypothetical protein|uniref:Uncharacterized protein n=1 Tax=Reyranella aquatilis TaxID=2035356 RepID=A0ABS8L2N2_9HYPH|nr:hypothetical protein [Reyranella aquatilis]MCC8432207.1 hypothetical protein [Reyranella aquatilis]
MSTGEAGQVRRGVIEAIILGRNDNYEPQWTEKLLAAIAYNRAVLTRDGYEFRVAFVEWNPPAGNPLLAPMLVERFPYVRCVVVAPEVHKAICQGPMPIMLNPAINAAVRTSEADYLVVTGGDCFFGRALADRIAREGLVANRLYRAERVNIRADIDFVSATPAEIEDPANIVSVDTCSEPPYDRPPFTNASGDFLMMDRATMTGLRGFDEAIDFSKLHLDSRLCWTCMDAGMDCELLGRIFHISHTQSYVNAGGAYDSQSYVTEVSLPYLNPDEWGLGRFAWTRDGDRVWHVGLGAANAPAPALDGDASRRAEKVRAGLVALHAQRNDQDPADGASEITKLPLDWVWVAPIASRDEAGVIEGAKGVVDNVAALSLPDKLPPPKSNERRWIFLSLDVLQGDLVVEAIDQNRRPPTLVRASREPVGIWLEMPPESKAVRFGRFRGNGPAVRLKIREARLFGRFRPSSRKEISRGLYGRMKYRLQRFFGPS